ncbi:hypothetical protein CSKR_101688 [Clonorchis sinensis]|uniref:Uncharacterized protein n=1 Tax=Clonorchis sinensis TaxID=79923 RepID=A0A3R7CKG6_CLOSI|nr:hypothetical protein CSKR_101688 [Clonorchis sinensis]
MMAWRCYTQCDGAPAAILFRISTATSRPIESVVATTDKFFIRPRIKLDALAARGQDGCRIVQIFDGGAVCRSNVLQPNDYITELDGHSMRHVTNLEAFQLLRHSSSRDGTVEYDS